ncbi:MAG: N-6 DNA methylase [Bacteroidota bacterium]
MSLFQNSVLNNYLKGLDSEKVDLAFQTFYTHFHNQVIQNNIRSSKEEQYQGEFLIDLFVKVLGYTKNPTPHFNLTTELKNVRDSKKTDGAILKDGKALAVIELKGTKTTDLNKVESQAFGYKNNQPGCKYVITSNFEKLRFYIDNAVDFEEFNLFTLTRERFKVLWLCLSSEYLLKDIPKKIKDESLTQEENVTKKLYKDYAAFRSEVFDAIQTENPEYDKLTLFKKTQKLLDRFLFIFFAEDRLLLPPNSIRSIINHWNELKEKYDEYFPLYDRFKKFFGYMNTGHKGPQHDIFAYNGGLFAPDEILDNIKINDDLLHIHTLRLSNYDFESEVSVNILGHIFEHSLNDIDEIQAEIHGIATDKSKTKRKKDGVFYTPKYITKYIVDNTLGKLCEEKIAELDIQEAEYEKERKGRQKKTIMKLVQKLEDYRNWLLQITICDPACGSGAFLNQALEFLISEHRYIDELQAKLFGDALVLSEVENSILENNIYGVDINEESVEIAKLSLWLRTAQKGRKLTSLNGNIKCGNSLIDDPEVAGDKAFHWKSEFPEVFAKGGFDVVIGNPPYVGEKGNSEIFDALKLIPKWNDYYRRRSNLYYFFIKLGIELLKPNGLQSLIIPREFTSADWSNKVRYEILKSSIIVTIVDFNSLKVFNDAGTTSLILSQKKSEQIKDYDFDFISLKSQESISTDLFDTLKIDRYSTSEMDMSGMKPWNFYQRKFNSLKTNYKISTYFDISQGLVTGADRVTKKHVVKKLITEEYLGRGIFILTKGTDIKTLNSSYQLLINNKWITLSKEEKRFIKPFIKTENLKKWFVDQSTHFVIYTGASQLTGTIKEYLLAFAGVLLNRSTTVEKETIITLEEFEKYSVDEIKANYSSAGAVQKIMRRKQWWMPLYERADVPFEGPKIIVNTKNMDKFTYSSGAHYSSGGGAGGQNYIYLNQESKTKISSFSTDSEFTKFVNCILNSKLIQTYIADGQYNQLSTAKIGDIPFVKMESFQGTTIYNAIIERVNVLCEMSLSLEKFASNFENYLSSKLSIETNISLMEESFDLIEFFTRNKIRLSVSEEAEWMQYFSEQKQKANSLKSAMDKTEKEIDQIVYELYGLDAEEIKIVEESA